jgi:hypothetical protein
MANSCFPETPESTIMALQDPLRLNGKDPSWLDVLTAIKAYLLLTISPFPSHMDRGSY